MKILLINAPPRAGKDTLGRAIVERADKEKADEVWTAIRKFAFELKTATHRLYGIQPGGHPWHGAEQFENSKDIPNDKFFGLTPRQAYIAVSEKLMKPMHGKDIFGKLLANSMAANAGIEDLSIITDSGFVEEAQVLIDRFGVDNVVLVQLHREGFDFSNDSRSYIKLPVRTIEADLGPNLSKLEEIADLCFRVVMA